MRSSASTLLLAAAAPVFVAAVCPDPVPQISSLSWSGSGCPSTSASSVKNYGPMEFGEVKTFTFNQLDSDNTENCEIHLQAAQAPSGWQVAVRDVAYSGDVMLKPNSQLDYFTQVYWSEKADDTGIAKGTITNADTDVYNRAVTIRSTVPEKWSKCISGSGPGILNVNFRPVINGDAGRFSFKNATWHLDWRKC
ncbi:uncharacterized protein BDR25DRAFT_276064 [Lindgomyces ingoldianus]|uniref:Uncharacterized protein n=1 Tax=Lindgomyces ingoldianus TaxID=673940 RepID=A0ACB6RHM5_9PLEO|nr:uncharacterized protein BDR25DRAFT_276064 [Lindgomyces ingoldianus]KAF2478225.1 hypothetical protein BDR25DRAFT_276064 [Lindgomyces ingoldianus]